MCNTCMYMSYQEVLVWGCVRSSIIERQLGANVRSLPLALTELANLWAISKIYIGQKEFAFFGMYL